MALGRAYIMPLSQLERKTKSVWSGGTGRARKENHSFKEKQTNKQTKLVDISYFSLGNSRNKSFTLCCRTNIVLLLSTFYIIIPFSLSFVKIHYVLYKQN